MGVTKVDSEYSLEEKSKADSMYLLWHELAPWQQDNEYIQSSYRPISGCFSQSLRSLGYIHNETVNIYTHLFGGLLFAGLPFYVYSTVYRNGQLGDMVVFTTFFAGVAICFIFSACFHTISNHSQRVAAVGRQLDYTGIVVLMWGSTIPSVYYGFYCDLRLQKIYWSVISVLSLTSIAVSLDKRFQLPHFRPYRAALYSSLGFSALIFVTHGLIKYGWEIQNDRMSLSCMGLMGALNIISAITYAFRIPERWVPLRHDVYGNSHQILHVGVILAGLTHMVGLLNAFDHIHSQISPCVPR